MMIWKKLSLRKWKTCFSPEIHFNISHSASFKVISVSPKKAQLGVDLWKKIKPIDFEDFQAMFSAKEWSQYIRRRDPLFGHLLVLEHAKKVSSKQMGRT